MNPFLKWPGGKRWLVARTTNLFPASIEDRRYFEPFLGGGAVFFHLQPISGGCLSDINPDLINTYEVIRDDWGNLMEELTRFDRKHDKEFYYKMRSYKPKTPLNQAARFVYLNRTCWNGLYRVNQKGEFNVPIGTKQKVVLPEDNFERLSKLLQQTTLQICDFEQCIGEAHEGDFVFVDPPYTVKHNLNGFVKYNENIFTWQDQIRLRDCVREATGRGASVLVLNANHESIRTLYRGMGDMITLDRASVIAGNSGDRGMFSELAIKC